MKIAFRWRMLFGIQKLNLQPEKSIKNKSKYQSIEKHDRTMSMADDGNEHMIIVSQIQKNDRFRKKV